MTLSRRFLPFLLLLLSAATGYAQTPLGQPTLDEQKVQIWCATARFVYDDTGHPELKSQLNCGGSIKEFENSIKADNQRVYSALFQPLEVKGVMYKGLGSNSSRLQTLVREIVNRLRTSPSRKGNAARLQGVASLEAALKNYVDNGTPISEVATPDASALGAAPDTTATETAEMPESGAADTGDAGLAEAGVASATPAANSNTGDSLMNKLFGPLALIMSLLSLVLYVLLRRNIAALGERLGRHRTDIDSVKAASLTPAVGSPAAAPADRLTAAQQREVEKLVQQRVEEAVKKFSQQLAATAAAAPVAPASAQPPRPAEPAPAPSLAPASAPTVAAPVVAAAPAEPTAPASLAPEPAVTAPQEEFESLLPPVQLPAPPAYAPPVPVSSTRYVKIPVNGAFSEYDLTEEPQHDSIYEIHLDPQWPELATFRVTSNPQVHAYAIQSAQYSLREACRYQQPAGPVSRIVTEEDGVLRKVSGAWQIEQKAAVRFE